MPPRTLSLARRPNPEMKIGRQFFEAALKDYQDWEEKWWREAVQNSFDAGAKNIRLSADQQDDGTWLVAADDDGKGMSVETLVDKFLVLGGSTKQQDSGAAGGFGKAKELLLLPWISWAVHVDGHIARGEGVTYHVEPGPPRKGVKLEVRMAADRRTTPSYAKTFLSKCDLRGRKVFVNGEEWTGWMVVKKKIRTMEDKADVYVLDTKGETESALLVRTKGIYMFDLYLPRDTKSVVVVELTAPSIELLTANRDGFRNYSLKYAIERFGAEVAKDVRSALKAKTGMIEKIYRGTGKFEARVEQREHDAETIAEVITENVKGTKTRRGSGAAEVQDAAEELARKVRSQAEEDVRREGGEARETAVLLPSAETARQVAVMDYRGEDHLKAAMKQLVWQPDFYLVNEIEGWRVPKGFFPETMRPRVVKLLRVWVEMCRFVLMQLGTERTYGVGFIFSKDTGAQCRRENGESWLMLNPFRKPGDDSDTTVLSANNPDDVGWLYAAAIHECTHLANGLAYHDEAFAAAMTMNVALCHPGWPKLSSIVRSIKVGGSAEADTDEGRSGSDDE